MDHTRDTGTAGADQTTGPAAPEAPIVVVTGASGRVGRVIVPLLEQRWNLRLLDLQEPDYDTSASITIGSILDEQVLAEVCAGAYAVVHLAGIANEAPWAEVIRVNVDGTQRVFAAAKRAGVARVVHASSIHAVGSVAVPPPGERVGDDLLPQPDSYYGVSKATAEAMGSFYHHVHGLDVVAIRIGSCMARPSGERILSTWLSPRDLANLVTAALTAASPVNAVVWGVSGNASGRFSLDGARALGWEPLDDASDYADEVRQGAPTGPISDGELRWIGGGFYTPLV